MHISNNGNLLNCFLFAEFSDCALWINSFVKAFERSRNSENKTTEKRAVSYLFIEGSKWEYLHHVLLIFYLFLRRKIVFKNDYIIMQIRFYNDEWTVLREGPRWKTTLRFWIVWLASIFTRLENRALFNSFG